MENKFAEQFEAMNKNIFDGVDWNNPSSLMAKLEQLKEIADKSTLWKHRVESRTSIILFGYELDFLEKMMGELVWLVGNWESNEEDYELEESMELLERYIEYLPAFQNVVQADVYRAINVLKDWFATTSREPHYLAWSLYKTYKNLGDQNLEKKYLEELKILESTNPFKFSSMPTSCESCKTNIRIQYYSSIGILDKAISIAEPLLEDDVGFCLTSPRTGLSGLLTALLDAGRFSDAKKLIPTVVTQIDQPFKAPLRLVNPLLRYYLRAQKIEEAQKIIDDYESKANNLADRITANYFFELVNSISEKNMN